MFEDFLNDKINREFLSNHIGKCIEITGKFIAYDNNHRILAEDCCYYDELVNSNINLGHMWWQEVNNYKEYSNVKKQTLITVMGIVTEYKNKDKKYSSESTIGLSNCTILKVMK